MKVLFIYDGDYPWDIRVEKLCNTLMRLDHEVHMICRNKSRRVNKEIYKGINIHRIMSVPLFFGKLNEALTFPAFFSPIWFYKMHQQAKLNKCDIIIVRDLPMAMAAVWVGRLLNIPVIMDMAECYPEMLRCIWKFGKRKIRNYFLRNPKLADIIEKKVLHSIDAVMVMVEESRDRLLSKGVAPNKIYIVSNTPEIDRFKLASKGDDRSDNIRLLYVGLLSASRGVDFCIRAVRKYIDYTGHDIEFNIAGTGNYQKELVQLVKELGLQKNVNILGWIDNKEVPALISANNVCVVPHLACTHWNNTIPNKLFDYMAAAKAVLVSDVSPVKRIVNSTNSGIVYKNTDINDFVEKLTILEQKPIRETYGINGRNAIIKKYNWQNEEMQIAEMLLALMR